jgi:hypothetical protein
MTDSNLSPAAQAVLSAWAKPVDVDRSLVINGKALEFQARGALAAALRAAVEQVMPEVVNSVGDKNDDARHELWVRLRCKFLAIAAELENTND